MRTTAIIALLLLPTVGCVSDRRPYGRGYSPGTPKIQMSVLRYDTGLDVLPVPMTAAQVAFSYPFEMSRAGLTGEVLATATIAKDGRVDNVAVTHATLPEFSEHVIAGLKRCVFSPAKKGGVDVPSVVQCRIEFLLDED